MKTYQDFLRVAGKDGETGRFILTAVNDYRGSREYRNAFDAMAYYNKHNLTIERFQKWLYTISGRQVPDLFSSNYKIKSLIFRRLVTQQTQYVLGNGLFMDDKEKLGKDIDIKLQTAAKMSLVQGKAYGYWNYDHLEIFTPADYGGMPGFLPLLDEDTSELMAGIRFWYRDVGGKQVFRATLYEPDGVTEWKKGINDQYPEILTAKRGYKQTVTSNAFGTVDVCEENYSRLPIVTLYGSDTHESELVGLRESIDCYDFIKSGLANDIDDTSGFYWIVKNSGGMDDTDLAKFVQRMKTVKAAAIDGDEGASAEARTLSIPYEARTAALNILRKDIYEDAQLLDASTLSAEQLTATAIQTAYQSQDNKCADFEAFIIDFLQEVCELAGADSSDISFHWNKIINESEQVNMVLAAANYLDDESILKHLPFIAAEEIPEILARRDDGDLSRMGAIQPQQE